MRARFGPADGRACRRPRGLAGERACGRPGGPAEHGSTRARFRASLIVHPMKRENPTRRAFGGPTNRADELPVRKVPCFEGWLRVARGRSPDLAASHRGGITVANPCRTLTGFPILPTAAAVWAPRRRHVCCCAEHSTQMPSAREALFGHCAIVRVTSLVRLASRLDIGRLRSWCPSE